MDALDREDGNSFFADGSGYQDAGKEPAVEQASAQYKARSRDKSDRARSLSTRRFVHLGAGQIGNTPDGASPDTPPHNTRRYSSPAGAEFLARTAAWANGVTALTKADPLVASGTVSEPSGFALPGAASEEGTNSVLPQHAVAPLWTPVPDSVPAPGSIPSPAGSAQAAPDATNGNATGAGPNSGGTAPATIFPAPPAVEPSATSSASLLQAQPVVAYSEAPAAAQASPDGAPASITGEKQADPALGWNPDWRAAAAAMPCGSCTGRACTVCSIRIGGPTAANGMPTGYAPRVLEFYDPAQSTPAVRALAAPMAGVAAAATAQNAITIENQKQGTPEDVWMIDAADPTIEGYAAQFSLDHGQTVDFKINTDSTNYRIDIYRLGYYGGDGARKVATIDRQLTSAQVQPTPLFDPTTKLVDAGNWSVSASWAIPSDAVSGVYFAELTRLDGSKGRNIIPFVVRDDEAPSDITFQTSDTTWEAYNWWGGYNLYGGIDEAGRAGRASAVSYNRPFITRDGGFSAGPQDYIFGAEYPAIRWLEQNGYDVNYISGIDSSRSGEQLLNSKIFLSVGHDEYWSADQRTNVEAARDAGVNLAFMSGNEVYWETRWAPSIDGSNTPYRTMVSYKERWDNDDTDPGNTTSTWRDPQFGAGQPENGLTGTIFTVDSYRLDTIEIPYDLSNFRFWNNTAVADIQPGQVYSLTKNLLGYEWDSDLDNGARPAGLINLSDTTVDVNTLLMDYGSTTGPGTADHSLTLYRAPSGALVFGAGTVYWSWGLDDHHDNEATPTDPNVQQAMVNLFADMGVQPATLMSGLVAAQQTTDHVAPVSVITSPNSGAPLTAGKPVVISGTATDSGGGSVAVVEVSTDGGTSWHRASGFANWTYSWTPLAGGNYTLKTRAVDDSINLEVPGAGITVAVAAASTVSFFQTSDTPENTSDIDSNFVNLGMRFSSSQSGTIVGIRFYKGIGDGGTHVGTIWSATGTKLGEVTFTDESASGWQTATFSNPIQIAAGTTYVASYNSHGGYASTNDYFTSALTKGPLTAPAGNGYYQYSNDTAFPAMASNGTNYWIDPIFSPTNSANQPPVGVNDDGYLAFRDTPMVFTAAMLLANDSDPNGDILSLTGAGAASGGSVVFDANAKTITFTPNAGYTGPASFGYSVSDGRGGTGSAIVNMTVAPPSVSLFSAADTPAVLSDADSNQVNLGVRFTSSTAGTISGIRYYKSANDTGTHTGSLWSSTGALLATATFTNETASGWQTVTFSNPVSISAGATYVASFHSNGHYASTGDYFTTAKTHGPLTAPAASNGVYSYGTSNAFPTNTYAASNYWVDVLFNPTSIANQLPVAANDSGLATIQNTALQIAAARLLANDSDPDGDPLSITGVSAASNGTVSFDAQNKIVIFTPAAGYNGVAGFTYAIADGRGGTASANVSINVTQPTQSLFAANDTPATITVNDTNAVELGMKFTASTGGTISGVRFYKGPQNTGTHTGSLWSSTGTLLSSVTFTNETASGWQTANFASPVQISANQTYVVSYHTNGYYSADSDYFQSPASNGTLTAPSSSASGGNGVFAYGGTSAFPTGTYNATNYWVDVLFNGQLAA